MTAPTAPQALPALLARVRAAEKGDREIDEGVWHLFNEYERPTLGEYYGWERWSPGSFRRPTSSEGPPFESLDVPLFTSSIDACVALAERVLPGRWWRVTSEPAASVSGGRSCEAATPALALLAAIISALIAKEQSP